MSRNTDIDRRTVVKALGAGAGLSVGFGAGGTASASDDGIDTASHGGGCNCFFETRCDTSRFCEEQPDPNMPYQHQHRECCTCDGNTVCEDTWSDVNTACCSG